MIEFEPELWATPLFLKINLIPFTRRELKTITGIMPGTGSSGKY
jgi:hypothetical protein